MFSCKFPACNCSIHKKELVHTVWTLKHTYTDSNILSTLKSNKSCHSPAYSLSSFAIAGETMRIASSEFADDPCSSVKRGTMVRAARALLSAVTRLLILADMADVMRLLSHLKIVRAIITLYSAKRNVLLQQHSAVFLPVDMALWPYRVMKPCQLVSYVVLELQSEVRAGTLQILMLTYPTCFEMTPEIFLQVVVLSV